jgi:hypothetical protein
MNLGTNDLNVVLYDTPLMAPTYRKPEYKPANLTIAGVVGDGTVDGNPTVDLIFEDESGQKYVAMLTGNLIDGVATAVKAMKAKTG